MIKLTVVLTFVILLPTSGVSAQEFPADTRPFVNLAYKVKDGDRYVRVGSGTIQPAFAKLVAERLELLWIGRR